MSEVAGTGAGYTTGGGFALLVVLFILLIIIGASWVGTRYGAGTTGFGY
ncbi:YjcZ family sporulation protein [Anaerobacillus sp. MEB173]